MSASIRWAVVDRDGAVLRELAPGFASGHLKPFQIKPSAIYPLEQAKAAFVAVRALARPRDPAAGLTGARHGLRHIVILAALVIGLNLRRRRVALRLLHDEQPARLVGAGRRPLVRTYALAMGVAIAASQLLAARAWSISASRSICSHRSRYPSCLLAACCSAMAWCCRTAAARARWCCLARQSPLFRRGDRARHFAEMTLKGMIAPGRIAMVQVSQITAKVTSVPALLSLLE